MCPGKGGCHRAGSRRTRPRPRPGGGCCVQCVPWEGGFGFFSCLERGCVRFVLGGRKTALPRHKMNACSFSPGVCVHFVSWSCVHFVPWEGWRSFLCCASTPKPQTERRTRSSLPGFCARLVLRAFVSTSRGFVTKTAAAATRGGCVHCVPWEGGVAVILCLGKGGGRRAGS